MSKLGLSGNTPCPLVVVHSGNATMTRFGCSATSVPRSVIFAPLDGYSCGLERALKMAPRRDIYSTCRVWGYETVKIGSNIAARYRASIGDVEDDAMTLDGEGTRPSCFLASDPFLTPSICRSIHQIPGVPNIVHSIAFLKSDPSGNHCSMRK